VSLDFQRIAFPATSHYGLTISSNEFPHYYPQPYFPEDRANQYSDQNIF